MSVFPVQFCDFCFFVDVESFDFEGDIYRSTGFRWGMLANSNQRSRKGFIATFRFNRDWFLGQFKLDWIFVKPCCVDNSGDDELGKLSPYFGRTLFELNYAPESPVSDHVPITVDLPLNPPCEDELEKRREKLEKLKKILDKT